MHLHTYPWHNSSTKHNHVPYPHDLENDPKAASRFLIPYGEIDPSSTSNLQHYDLQGLGANIDNLIKTLGYRLSATNVHHHQNYDTKHLWVTPSTNENANSYRKLHELAHALTLPAINQLYGEGNRNGVVGRTLTIREAKRILEWEWQAVCKQRELTLQAGGKIHDKDFQAELNTVMADALERLTIGKCPDLEAQGFLPYKHQVPLAVAFSLLGDFPLEPHVIRKSEIANIFDEILSF